MIKSLFICVAKGIRVIRVLFLEMLHLLVSKSWQRKRENHIFSMVASCTTDRPAIVVWIPFMFWPPNFGGGVRIANVYGELSKHYQVHLVGIGAPGEKLSSLKINPNLTAWFVPLTYRYALFMRKEERRSGGKLHDILLATHFTMVPDLVLLCRAFSGLRPVMVASHPYLFPLIEKHGDASAAIYEAHNVDYQLKKTYFKEPGKNKLAVQYMELVRSVEENACKKADKIMAVSAEDATDLSGLYDVSAEKILLIPNCIDTGSVPFIRREEAQGVRKKILFIGSDHEPNREAVRFILEQLAPVMSQYQFVIAGTVNRSFTKTGPPGNVLFTGFLEPEEKEAIYRECALAVNPMFSGSGTNLKVPEQMAAGIPLVSTSFGMRGLEELIPGVYLAEKENFAEETERVSGSNIQDIHKKTERARKLAEKNYDKSVAVSPLLEYLKTFYENHH